MKTERAIAHQAAQCAEPPSTPCGIHSFDILNVDQAQAWAFLDASAKVYARIAREAAYFRLLRQVLIGQARGDFDAGEKLNALFRDVDHPLTEELFDQCMERALKAIGG
jgi:hypothetical protein